MHYFKLQKLKFIQLINGMTLIFDNLEILQA